MHRALFTGYIYRTATTTPRIDVAVGVDGVAVPVVVLGGPDSFPAEAFVEADGADVLGHDVEDEPKPVRVRVLGGGTYESPADGVSTCLGEYEESAEYRDLAGVFARGVGPDQGCCIIGLGFAKGDVPDDAAIQFGDPSCELVGADKPPAGEAPWVGWRPVLWVSDRGLVGPVGSVERLLVLGR